MAGLSASTTDFSSASAGLVDSAAGLLCFAEALYSGGAEVAGFFVYCNGIADVKAFDKKLEFRVNLIPYKGDDSWVEKAIIDAHKCLNSNKIPKAHPDCDYCSYIKSINNYG